MRQMHVLSFFGWLATSFAVGIAGTLICGGAYVILGRAAQRKVKGRESLDEVSTSPSFTALSQLIGLCSGWILALLLMMLPGPISLAMRSAIVFASFAFIYFPVWNTFDGYRAAYGPVGIKFAKLSWTGWMIGATASLLLFAYRHSS